jgi:hypothetical protein
MMMRNKMMMEIERTITNAIAICDMTYTFDKMNGTVKTLD